MSKFFVTGQATYNYLKIHLPGDEQSIRDQTQLCRLLPADKTEADLENEQIDLASRINGFDIEVEIEKKLARQARTVIIAPLSDNFKHELMYRFFALSPEHTDDVLSEVEDTYSFE